LKQINVTDLLAKKIQAPFKPKLPDFNEMVRNLSNTVGIKDLNETAIPEKNKKLIKNLETELFSEFGTNIDYTSRETIVQRRTFAEDFENRNLERVKMAPEEETKPEPK